MIKNNLSISSKMVYLFYALIPTYYALSIVYLGILFELASISHIINPYCSNSIKGKTSSNQKIPAVLTLHA